MLSKLSFKKPEKDPDSDYKRLETPCPVFICSGDKEIRKWMHANCGAPSEINSDAMVRCSKCKQASSILLWHFACQNHANKFYPADALGLAQAVTMLRCTTTSPAERLWHRKLTRTVTEMMNNQVDLEEAGEDGQRLYEGPFNPN